MLMPTMRTNVFDDLFNTPFFTKSEGMMKTDIKEHDNCYDLMIDLPGVKKEDIKAELNDGYLTVSAENNTSKDEKDDNGKYICRERYSGSYSRSFYVGDALTQEDIKASFKHGILKLEVPKKEKKPEIEKKNYVAIEG